MSTGAISSPRVDASAIPEPLAGPPTNHGRIAYDDPLSGEKRPCTTEWTSPSGSKGTEITATGDGLVVEAGRHESGYGNEVVIDHGRSIQTNTVI